MAPGSFRDNSGARLGPDWFCRQMLWGRKEGGSPAVDEAEMVSEQGVHPDSGRCPVPVHRHGRGRGWGRPAGNLLLWPVGDHLPLCRTGVERGRRLPEKQQIKTRSESPICFLPFMILVSDKNIHPLRLKI